MSLTLRRIRSFIAVAERGSFRKAASEFATSQPALTGHVRELEEVLGVPLLNRTTRHVSLTEEGRVFLARAKRALGEIDSAVDELKQQAALQRGRIVIGCTPSIAASILPRALLAFRRRHPGIELQIYDDRWEVVERRLLTGEIDFVVGPSPQRSDLLAFRHLGDDPFMALCPVDHPLGRARAVTLKELARYPVIAMRPGVHMRHALDRAFSENGLELRPLIEVFSHYTLTGLVSVGMGVGVLPRMTISIAREHKINVARIVEPEISRSIGVTLRRGEALTAAAAKFVELFDGMVRLPRA
ncbi:MAG TPA: LysR family transcriptional regulator [Stellaceae bacterium]|nr:LysR family transcriptional regulator [Stellaceae bacterium]